MAADPLPELAHFRGRHFLSDLDYTRDELSALLTLTGRLKALWRRRRLTPFLAGHHLAMIFEAASTRTRVSFENGFAELGGNTLFLRPGEIHLHGRESIGDTARTLSQYNSAIEIRSLEDDTVSELADWSEIPVINGMDSRSHPCQSVSDAYTILEQTGRLEGLTFAYVGEASHACNSLATTLTKLGLHVRMANPAGYEISHEVRRISEELAEQNGGSFTVMPNPEAAVVDADFVYTDTWWWWSGHKDDYSERVEAFRPYQVNKRLWARTKPGAKFMHCLPAMRGMEVTDDVADGEASIIFQQAQNRMHFQKALMLALIGIDELPDDPDLQPIGEALLR